MASLPPKKSREKRRKKKKTSFSSLRCTAVLARSIREERILLSLLCHAAEQQPSFPLSPIAHARKERKRCTLILSLQTDERAVPARSDLSLSLASALSIIRACVCFSLSFPPLKIAFSLFSKSSSSSRGVLSVLLPPPPLPPAIVVFAGGGPSVISSRRCRAQPTSDRVVDRR